MKTLNPKTEVAFDPNWTPTKAGMRLTGRLRWFKKQAETHYSDSMELQQEYVNETCEFIWWPVYITIETKV